MVNSAGDILVSDNYNAESLYKNTITDEDGTQVTIFTDAEGKTILERRLVATNSYADTYYVYDVKNRLRWVITPKGSDLLTNGTTYSITDTLAKDHCYIYQYDNEDRITERRLPGCEPSCYSYDSYGRLTTYIDATLNNLNIRQSYSYDALNRISRVSYLSNSSTEEYVQHTSHYDNYNAMPATLAYNVVSGVVSASDRVPSIKGKLAYERIFEVYDAESTTTPKELTRAYYYDKRDRVIQTVTLYPDNILCRTSVKYDYVGNPLTTVEKYTYGTKTFTIRTDRTFDERSRQLTEQTTIDGTVINNATFSYDELGRMKRLELGDNVEVNTSYNLQGWISSISSDIADSTVIGNEIFTERLSYYNTVDANSTPLYSGKISEQRWTYGNIMNDYSGFAYTYDSMGRLTDARMFRSSLSQNKPLIGTTREQIAYDKNSNVVQLSDTIGLSTTTRNYAVQGNQVVQMIVNGNNMGYPTYDERGNMTQNVEAGLQMSYNLCNLPKQITAANGTSVKYSYFADGTKFKAVNAAGNGFAYTGSLRWSVQNGVLTPESVAITGGRALYNDVEEPWSVNYYITDHLGSVRAVTDADGEVLDTYDYMPYGSEFTTDTDNITDYRFTCKEKQLMFGNSNIYDSFARFQNTYGRFMSIDPKAESFYHISPYTYCAGDPVNLVDPDGRDWYQSNSNSGNPEYHYVQGVLSEEEMQNNGYIHLGHTYHSQNTYYSLFGGIFHSDNRIDKWRYKAIKMADQTIINMFYDPNHDFWNSLNNTISSGTSIAGFIAEYKDVSSSTKKIINRASSITLVYKYCDIAINNDFADYYKKPEHILDLAIDIISYTRPEAAILGMIMSYTSEKGTKFILELETELQRKADGLYYEMINLMNGGF